tara:strand:+ start:7247 stop:7372 length:126 start_codon:yes stop_codon:yes gene_type:complete
MGCISLFILEKTKALNSKNASYHIVFTSFVSFLAAPMLGIA